MRLCCLLGGWCSQVLWFQRSLEGAAATDENASTFFNVTADPQTGVERVSQKTAQPLAVSVSCLVALFLPPASPACLPHHSLNPLHPNLFYFGRGRGMAGSRFFAFAVLVVAAFTHHRLPRILCVLTMPITTAVITAASAACVPPP